MDINLNLYKSFYNVIKYGSFTKAAEKLNVSQPGLSYNIKKLEDELGYKLLDRTKDGISLTSFGKTVYKNLITVFNILDNILEIKNNDVVKIRLAARVGLATRKLINIVRDFNKLNSNIEVVIDIRHYNEFNDLFQNDQVDIIVDEYKYNGKNVRFEQFETKFRPCFIVPTSIKDAYKNVIIDNSFLQNNEITIVPTHISSKELISKYNPIHEKCTTTEFLKAEVLYDEKIGFSSDLFFEYEIKNGIMSEIPNNLDLKDIIINISYKDKSNEIRQFVDFLKIQ